MKIFIAVLKTRRRKNKSPSETNLIAIWIYMLGRLCVHVWLVFVQQPTDTYQYIATRNYYTRYGSITHLKRCHSTVPLLRMRNRGKYQKTRHVHATSHTSSHISHTNIRSLCRWCCFNDIIIYCMCLLHIVYVLYARWNNHRHYE